jgi:hypothetical protein
MRLAISMLTIAVLAGGLIAKSAGKFSSAHASVTSRQARKALQTNSLCARDEHIIFSCTIKHTAKIVSLCASKELDKERGYLQYRFGLPGKVELEYPKDQKGTQPKFHYSHYFRAQVDETEINFNIDGYEYSVFDTYNGEEKPAISEQGVHVTAGGKKEASFVCGSKPKADYSALQDVLSSDQE